MKVHVILSNNFDEKNIFEIKIKQSVCGVIDTIRATSTIATILGCGGRKILIASNIEEAFLFKKFFPSFILCGEQNGLPPKGFDYGNSPLDISTLNINDDNFILMTTNGTKSILKVRESKIVYAISLLNLNSVIDCMVKEAISYSFDILLLCSGEKGKIAYDDAYTAGMAIKNLMTKPYNFEFTDSAKLVLAATLSEFNVADAMEKSYSAKSLRSVGLGDDIAFLSQINKYNVCPKLYKINSQDKKMKLFLKNLKNNKDNTNKNNISNLKNEFKEKFKNIELTFICNAI